MRTSQAATFLLSTALACASASAETLNFEGLPAGDLGTSVLNLPQAHIQSLGTTLFANSAFTGTGGSICAAFHPTVDATSCASDLLITFSSAVSHLSLYTTGYDDGDSVTISAYAGSMLLDNRVITSDTAVDFSSLSGVTKLVFDDQSTGSGYAYGNFSFTLSASAVPEPASALLMLLGAAALLPLARRRSGA